MDFRTDNIIGTVDDMMVNRVAKDAYHNFHAVTAEAIAYRALKKTRAYKAERSLRYAVEDFQFATRNLPSPNLKTYSVGAIASVELYHSTKQKGYLDKAVEFAKVILVCQQQTEPDWDIPLSGFFYRTAAKRRIQYYPHLGENQLPVAALVMLCETMTDRPGQPHWRKCIELYASYLKKTTQYTAPYYCLAASIYSLGESKDAGFQEQVKNGIRLGDRNYLRHFPVWFDLRGNYGVLLSQSRALTMSARLLKARVLWDLAQKQLQRVAGLNPFCQNTMYGEGYNFAPQYTATSGNIAGGLPVGIQTSRNHDEPFWPADNCYNFKEIWVRPSLRWLGTMTDLEAIKRVDFLRK